MDLEGVVNMRDVGGLPTSDGRRTRYRRLLRSDNLQDLTQADIDHLVDDLGVTDIVDLRSNLELHHTGPGPLRATELAHHHHSFHRDDRGDLSPEEALALRWSHVRREHDDDFWASHYLGYLHDRPDSVSAALEVVAGSDGATVVHCAAGKDRTGTVVALALGVAGVPDELVVADYAATSQRIEQIMSRLLDQMPYSESLRGRQLHELEPQARSMERLLEVLAERHGGAAGWLHDHGWTAEQIEELRQSLVE